VSSSPLALLAVVAASIAGLVLINAAVCWWEKRLVWPYVPLALGPQGLTAADPSLPLSTKFPEPSPRARRALAEASDRGFTSLGTFGDGKGPLYRLTYSMMFSRERGVLAIVGSGTLAGIPLEGTWLYSPLPSGRMLATIDNPGATAGDVSGTLVESLFAAITFGLLLEHHEEQRAKWNASGMLFSATDPLAQLREHRASAASLLEHRGLLRFLTPERNAWRYTLVGATVVTARTYARGFVQYLSPSTYVKWRKPR